MKSEQGAPMSTATSTSPNLPTATDLLRWREELDRLIAEESEMKARHAAEAKAIKVHRTRLDRLIEAASAFVDVEAEITDQVSETDAAEPSATEPAESTPLRAEPVRPRSRRHRSKTWTATILKIVKTAGRGMTYNELKDQISKTHLGDTLKRTDKALYGGVGKLVEKKKIVKYKGRIYTPTAYRQFMDDVAAGRVADIRSSTSSGESPNEIAIKRFLSSRPDGAAINEIVDSLLNDPPPDLAVTKNRNSIYNLLARQRARGKLIRRANRYYLPHQDSEAPGSKEPGAPDHHGGGNGISPSSGGNASSSSLAALPGAVPAHRPGE